MYTPLSLKTEWVSIISRKVNMNHRNFQWRYTQYKRKYLVVFSHFLRRNQILKISKVDKVKVFKIKLNILLLQPFICAFPIVFTHPRPCLLIQLSFIKFRRPFKMFNLNLYLAYLNIWASCVTYVYVLIMRHKSVRIVSNLFIYHSKNNFII